MGRGLSGKDWKDGMDRLEEREGEGGIERERKIERGKRKREGI